MDGWHQQCCAHSVSLSISSEAILSNHVEHQRWTVLYKGGSKKSQIIQAAYEVCACAWWRAHPCGDPGERSLIQQYRAETIKGAISSSVLTLIGLIIILLTYCPAICILLFQRSYCKMRTSFPVISLYEPPFCLYEGFQYCLASRMITHRMWCDVPLFGAPFKSLTLHLFTIKYITHHDRVLFLAFNYREIWLGTHEALQYHPVFLMITIE